MKTGVSSRPAEPSRIAVRPRSVCAKAEIAPAAENRSRAMLMDSLETAACLWEAVLTLRDHPSSDPDAIALALAIRQTCNAVGTADLRLTVVGWASAARRILATRRFIVCRIQCRNSQPRMPERLWPCPAQARSTRPARLSPICRAGREPSSRRRVLRWGRASGRRRIASRIRALIVAPRSRDTVSKRIEIPHDGPLRVVGAQRSRRGLGSR